MKKLGLLILGAFLLLRTQAFAGDVSKAHTYLDGEVLTAALLNASVDEIIVEINDLDGDNLASTIAIITSGNCTFSGTNTLSGTTTVSGTFATTGTSNTIGNGGSDTLVLNAPSGITYTPAATWTFTDEQTVSGTWADLGIVTTVDMNGGTFDGVTIGGATPGSGTFSALIASDNLDIGSYDLKAETLTSDVTTGTPPLVVASTTVVANLNVEKLGGYSYPVAPTTAGIAGRQVFISDGTFTAPTNITTVYVSLVGAGGGAGAGRSQGGGGIAGGGGGGGGESIIRYPYTVIAANEYAVDVGAKGTGGATDGADGVAGASTIFDTGGGALTVSGGAKGIGGTAGGTGGAGASANSMDGSTTTGGSFYSIAGGSGAAKSGGSSEAGGGGGGSIGGTGGNGNASGNGVAGAGWGSGGGGGYGGASAAFGTGGDGTIGGCIVEW